MNTSIGLVAMAGMLMIGCGQAPPSDLPDVQAGDLGESSCSDLVMPTVQRCAVRGGIRECIVGVGRESGASDGLRVLPDGCVGAMLVLPGTATPDLQAPGGGLMFAAARSIDLPPPAGSLPVAADPSNYPESDPANRLPHDLLFDPVSRRLFVRSREPVAGPTQVVLAFNFDGLFPEIATHARPVTATAYFFRFYVGGRP